VASNGLKRALSHYKRVSLFPLLRNSEEYADHALHTFITVSGLLLALVFYLRQIKWPRPEINAELLLGLSVMALGLLLRSIRLIQLRRFDSLAIRPSASTHRNTDLVVKTAASVEDIEELARFIELAYPYRYVSKVDIAIRTKTYCEWMNWCPGFARTFWLRGSDGIDDLIGFSVIVRTHQNSYVRYRNGLNDPWTWDSSHIIDAKGAGTAFLFVQGLYCSRHVEGATPVFLYNAFLEHLAYFCSNPAVCPPVIYAPAMQKQSRANLTMMGFEKARISRGQFDIWELDCRKIMELSLEAQKTFSDLVVHYSSSKGMDESSSGGALDSIQIRAMLLSDYASVRRLLLQQKVSLRQTDQKVRLAFCLGRNSGMSLVAEINGEIIGALLCGHDGRAGYLHHLTVDSRQRMKGIGKQLVQQAVNSLLIQGISRCHAFVYDDNDLAHKFWSRIGWDKRSGLSIYTVDHSGASDASIPSLGGEQ